MKPWLFLAVFSASATAQTTPPADCKGLMFANMNLAIYRSQAVFPAEPRNVDLNFFGLPPLTKGAAFCGYVFKADQKAETLMVTAPKLTAFTNVFRERFINTGKIALENYYYGLWNRPSRVVFDPKTYRMIFDKAGYQDVRLTLAVKVDGGALQALHYENTAREVRVPKTARTIDIYARGDADTRVTWQRASINLRKPTVTFYRTATFPTK